MRRAYLRKVMYTYLVPHIYAHQRYRERVCLCHLQSCLLACLCTTANCRTFGQRQNETDCAVLEYVPIARIYGIASASVELHILLNRTYAGKYFGNTIISISCTPCYA